MTKIRNRIKSFKTSARRHGTIPTLLSIIYDQALRLVNFEICRVESNSENDYDWPNLELYETRRVSKVESQEKMSSELQVDYGWAFDRGDMCIGSIRNGEIVGYTFYSIRPTIVHDDLVFKFPSEYLYSYASLTAPLHRGNRLERERWKVGAAEKENMFGSPLPGVWYVNVANLAIRTANKNSGVTNSFHGYTLYARIFGRWFVFTSPKCKRFGAGFVNTKKA